MQNTLVGSTGWAAQGEGCSFLWSPGLVEEKKRKKIIELPENKNKRKNRDKHTCYEVATVCFTMNFIKSRALVVCSL